jgi:hypothetical protein
MIWIERSPRLGIALYQTASVSVLGAVVLAGLVLVVPAARASHGLSHLLDVCQALLRAHYGAPGEPAGAYAGLLIALTMTGWTLVHVAAALVSTSRARRRHARTLAIVACRRPDLGAFVLNDRLPLAYCLPGKHGGVVLTTGALDRLDDGQVAAMLAHERAHLRGRHHLVVNLAVAIDWAFPGVPLFRQAHAQILQLIELLADDAAARSHDRATVAATLVAVAAGRAPAGALGAGGPDGDGAIRRVRRLLVPHRPLSRAARFVGVLGVGLLMALPAVLAANPAITAMLERHCHAAIL